MPSHSREAGEVGRFRIGDRRMRMDEAGLRTEIDRRIESWLGDAPARLAADARRPFEVRTDRTRGQYVVLGTRAATGGVDPEGVLSVAASVEALYAQALLAARASGLADSAFGDMGRSRALLASDYLHALAYTVVARIDVEPSLGETCYRSLARASQQLTAAWSSVPAERTESVDHLPIEPIVTATAGDLAGCLARIEHDGRERLRTAGMLVGLADWQDDEAVRQPLCLDSFPASVRESFETAETRRIAEVLEPLPETEALDSLQTFLEQSCASPNGHNQP